MNVHNGVRIISMNLRSSDCSVLPKVSLFPRT